MNKYDVKYIVSRHLSGCKASQIKHISLTGVTKITMGRHPKSNFAFDLSPGDFVSRRRAVIYGIGDDQIPFRP